MTNGHFNYTVISTTLTDAIHAVGDHHVVAAVAGQQQAVPPVGRVIGDRPCPVSRAR